MPQNDFLAFATAGGANVMSQAAYAAAAFVGSGFSQGIADPLQLNKVWRQSSFVAAAIAQFIVNETGDNVLDDGNLTEFVTNFTAAIATAGGVPAFASNAQALAGIATSLIIAPSSLAYVISQTCLLLAGGTVTGNMTVDGVLNASGGLTANGGTFTAGVTMPAGGLSGLAIAAGSLVLTALANQAGGTVLANITGGNAPPTAVSYAALLAAMGVVIPTVSVFNSQQASGTASGEALTANSWNTRHLNTQVVGGITGIVLTGNQLTLVPAGTYEATASAVAQTTASVAANNHKLRLRNITDGTTAVVGQNSAYAGGANNNVVLAVLNGQFTLPSAKTLELDSWVSNACNGGPALTSAEAEVYASLKLTKVA